MSAFASTPTFELFRRGLNTLVIQRFHGMNAYSTLAQLGPDWAQDCLNVIISGSGGLSKFRLPVKLTPAIGGINTGPSSFWDFQQGNGTRQVLSFFGNSLYYFTNDLSVSNFVETNALNAGQWSMAAANNILFGANGQRMQKWTGANWYQWGINAPTIAPTLGASSPTLGASFTVGAGQQVTLVRAANVVTMTMAGGVSQLSLNVGDVVTVFNAVAATFNGSFKIASVVTPGIQYTYAQTAANDTAVSGNLTVPSSNSSFTIAAAPTGAVRASGVVTITLTQLLSGGYGVIPGQTYVTVAGVTDTSFNGTFPVIVVNYSVGTLTYAQPGLADATSGSGTLTFGITSTQGGWRYAYSWTNANGHESNLSPFSPATGNVTNRVLWVTAGQVPTDPQVIGINWYRTLDGGGDFFLIPTTALSFNSTFFDGTPDAFVDTTQKGQLINNPPIQGKYVAVGQSRVFVANLTGAPGDIEYSGYEQILRGRPEESFPPNNRLHLSIGAEAVGGIGILQAGVVGFSQTQKMYMLRGQVEDITLSVPVNFTQYLEELPWTLGCLSHFTIQSTPYGLIWLAGDKTVQLFDGSSEPIDISTPIYPILRTITPGTENQCVSGYFNWLERDFYVLLAAVGGSLTLNKAFFFAANKTLGTNTIESVEVFVSDIPASLGASWIGLVTTSKLQRMLCLGAQGFIQQWPVSSDTVNGITQDFTIIPATAGVLNAYWRSGYFGTDSPYRTKTFRWARLVADQDPSAFQAQFRYVDDEQRTFRNPEIVGPINFGTSRLGMNRKAKRASVEIDFPNQDTSINVLELHVAAVPTSDR
jgi:hypothetical protein